MRFLVLATLWIGALALTGCKMTAPMHIWKAPSVPKSGAVRIAVAPIGGNDESVERLQRVMQLAQPQPNPLVAALHPNELERVGGIQLVSFDNQPNDMATLGAARRAGMDYILQGHILESELDIPPPDPKKKYRFKLFKEKEHVEHITVHWSIIDVNSGLTVSEKTIATDRRQAEELYPDLVMQTQAGDGRVLMASARQAWALAAPTSEPTQSTLDLPWFSLGSSQVRKGNGFARQGRWDLAEQEWQEAASLHPKNKAAWKNLSLAAVAREDFTLARDRLKHADTFWPGDSTFSTLNWIEQRQREYHQSMDLPAPPEGWTIATPTKSVAPDEVPSSPPRDLKDMPWWTAIPIIPPPGWTWTQWWTQPIVL